MSRSRSNWADGVDDIHGHFSGGTGEVDAAQCKTMHPNAHLLQFYHGCADIDRIASEPVKLGDDQHVPLFPFCR